MEIVQWLHKTDSSSATRKFPNRTNLDKLILEHRSNKYLISWFLTVSTSYASTSVVVETVGSGEGDLVGISLFCKVVFKALMLTLLGCGGAGLLVLTTTF